MAILHERDADDYLCPGKSGAGNNQFEYINICVDPSVSRL
jgi:hypothetical protein